MLTLLTNNKNMNVKVIEMEKKMHNTHHKCIEIAGISSSITNNLLKEYVLLIFKKHGVLLEVMHILACHKL